MNFHQYVASALEEDPGLDDETIADRIIEEGDPDLIFPAVLFYVRSQRTSLGNHVLRMATRKEPVSRSEGRTIVGPTTSTEASVPLIAHDPLASRRDILSTSKIVPGLGYIANIGKVLHVIAEGCVKNTRSPYRSVYDEARVEYATREGWTPLHQHNAALRKVKKEILRDLWASS